MRVLGGFVIARLSNSQQRTVGLLRFVPWAVGFRLPFGRTLYVLTFNRKAGAR